MTCEGPMITRLNKKYDELTEIRKILADQNFECKHYIDLRKNEIGTSVYVDRVFKGRIIGGCFFLKYLHE